MARTHKFGEPMYGFRAGIPESKYQELHQIKRGLPRKQNEIITISDIVRVGVDMVLDLPADEIKRRVDEYRLALHDPDDAGDLDKKS